MDSVNYHCAKCKRVRDVGVFTQCTQCGDLFCINCIGGDIDEPICNECDIALYPDG